MSMLLILLFIVTFLIYVYLKFIYSYWKRKGFPYISPTLLIGNFSSFVQRKTAMGLNIYELYKTSDKPYEGIYILLKPALLVRDPNLIHQMCLKDFKNFHDRGIYVSAKNDPMSETMLSMKGKRWKNLRAKISPMFTTGKLKGMFTLIENESNKLVNYLQSMNGHTNDDNKYINFKELMTRYAIDVIGNVLFGIEINCLENPNHEMRVTEKRINGPEFINLFRNFSTFLFPELLEFLKISSIPSDVQALMMGVAKTTFEFRDKNNITSQKDMIEILMQLRKKDNDRNGVSNVDNNKNNVDIYDDDDDGDEAEEIKNLSMETLASQIFIFFAAGIDTSGSAITYILFEMSRNAKMRERLINDIDNALNQHNGKLTYESLNDMQYLELCILETIRKYPVLPFLNRICTQDYKLEDTGLKIEKGTPIIISLMGMFRDENYFKDALEFKPERFSDENKHLINVNAYIPFGDGPHTCIGLRLGKLIAKIGLVTLLRNFNFECRDDTEIEFDNFAITLVPKHGVDLKISKRVIF